MDAEWIIQEAREYVKDRLKSEPSGHDWWHIYRVAEWAKRLADQEEADPLVCELAALFHDLADEKIVPSKEEGIAAISAWLANHGADAPLVDHVLEIIRMMSYGGGGGKPMSTLEGRVVQDADRLDAIGAIGIARTFAFGGSRGRLMYDPAEPPRTIMTQEEYRSRQGTTINHFYEKLLKLKDLMNTPAARREAASRHAFMEQFLAQFKHEWPGE
ncbi:HD domain-containing protein [Paenibacillus sp. XY044]|uniref:HD domain-containing protein n=1 Tax=Paenibacillus sp. XY044 TaxID=2026089 RepID=UPI000B98A228|nr:HD domain-containing protein [Paenibacillus sp. XY044]OZB97976.1 phosphohydrolase [Paenibacillus sp. XY044]